MYLEKASIEDTLRRIASTARGSVVAFDYCGLSLGEHQTLGQETGGKRA